MTKEIKRKERLAGRVAPSKEVAWAMSFATKVAGERNTKCPDPRDLLTGIYLSALERLVRYWDEWERLEDFLTAECGLHQPRLFYWVVMCNALTSGDLSDRLNVFGSDASKILRRAEELASQNRSNEVRLEHLLVAVAENTESEICQKFVATGMRTEFIRSRMGSKER
jgi:hypothetical protein